MISVDHALAFAKDKFPHGPEELTKYLGINVRESKLNGCDGWCLSYDGNSVIRINEAQPRLRKRFTLAHELSHLLLGIPSDVGETADEMIGSDSAEERRVNKLAAELLIPTDIVSKYIQEPPVVAKTLERLAKVANVSQVMASIRVTNLAKQIGLENAAVVHFQNHSMQWQWSPSLRMRAETPLKLMREARKSAPKAFRHKQKDGKIIVASIIDNAFSGSSTLFVQLLSPEVGLTLSPYERRHELELLLFASNDSLRHSVQGCFGAFKSIAVGLTLEAAEIAFWERHCDKFLGTPMDSDAGREYVKLRLFDLC